MPIGMVKWFNATKGYGFIQTSDGGADVFVHISSLQLPRRDDLREGQPVEFELAAGRNGKAAAANVKLLGRSDMVSQPGRTQAPSDGRADT